jgi:MioC protein
MTGLADLCAEEIEMALEETGFECERQLMNGSDTSVFDDAGLILIVTSTYGQGEIPDNGLALFAEVEKGIDLSDREYAIFSLGDSTYHDTFCAAGDRWDEALEKCGAKRIVDVVRHDASSGTLAEDIAAEWATGWAEQLN